MGPLKCCVPLQAEKGPYRPAYQDPLHGSEAKVLFIFRISHNPTLNNPRSLSW